MPRVIGRFTTAAICALLSFCAPAKAIDFNSCEVIIPAAARVSAPRLIPAYRLDLYHRELADPDLPRLAASTGLTPYEVIKEIHLAGLHLSEGLLVKPSAELYRQITSGFQGRARREILSQLSPDWPRAHLFAARRKFEGTPTSSEEEVGTIEWDSWMQLVEYGNEILCEAEVVVLLHDEGLGAAEIAWTLYLLRPIGKNTHSPRPIGGVAHLLTRMGATQIEMRHYRGFVFHPDYGLIRQGDVFDRDLTFRFLIDHFQNPDIWIARALGFDNVDKLMAYYRSEQIRRDVEQGNRFVFLQTKDEAYDQQSLRRLDVDLTLRWMRLHEDIHPLAENFGIGPKLVGVPYHRVVTYDFPTMEDFWMAVDARAHQIGGRFLATSLKQVDKPEMLRALWQRDAVDIILDWVEVHQGRIPTPDDFGFAGPDQVRLDYQRVVGRQSYSPTRPEKHASRYFDSPEHLWQAVKARARSRGIACFPFLGTHFPNNSDNELIRLERGPEALDITLNWMLTYGRKPKDRDFGTALGKVGIVSHPLFGNGNCRPGGPRRENRYYDDPAAGWAALEERAKQRNLEEILGLF